MRVIRTRLEAKWPSQDRFDSRVCTVIHETCFFLVESK